MIATFKEGFVQMFEQSRDPNGFLQRLFTMKPGGSFRGLKVAIDIRRIREEVAVVISRGTNANFNDHDIFTTKEFTPPSYGEAVPFNVNDLLNRMAGLDPFSAAARPYTADLMAYMASGFTQINNKIIRAMELQAAQILQTGMLDLRDSNDDVRYSLDFKPKATHFPTSAAAWSGAGDKLADLGNLARVVRSDGKINSNALIMGRTASRLFQDDTAVQAQLDNRRIDIGAIRPEFADSGATFQGEYWVEDYRFELWTYPDTYDDPATGLATEYIDPNKVIMLRMGPGGTRLDRLSAEVPRPIAPDPRVANLLPGRMVNRAAGGDFDVSANVYVQPNGKQVVGELETSSMLAPVQIDGFGCLDTSGP